MAKKKPDKSDFPFDESPRLVEVDLPIIPPLTKHEHESKLPTITTEELDAEYDRLGFFKSHKDKLFDLLKSFEDKDCTLSNIELHKQLHTAQRTIRQYLAELEAEGKISRSYPKPNRRVIKVLKGK